MHSVCRCSLPVWRRSFLKKGTPCDLFLPRPGSAPGRIWPKTTTLVRDHEYFMHTKFHQNPSSSSGEEVENVKSLRQTDGRTTDGRTDDGRCTMTIAHSSLRLRWAKNIANVKVDKRQTDKQTDKQTNRQTNKQKKGQKQYDPDHSIRGHKNYGTTGKIFLERITPLLESWDKGQSFLKVGQTSRSKLMESCERSCHKENTCAIWKPFLFLMQSDDPRLKFIKSRSTFKVKVTTKKHVIFSQFKNLWPMFNLCPRMTITLRPEGMTIARWTFNTAI